MTTASFPAARIAGFCRRAVGAAWGRLKSAGGPASRRPAAAVSRPLRPVVVPASLDDLHGPSSGVVELPVRLYWSGSRQFDLADPDQAADMYEAVLDVATTPEDLASYLNADVLIRVWPVLGLTRARQIAWESQFPVLRRQRLAAVA